MTKLANDIPSLTSMLEVMRHDARESYFKFFKVFWDTVVPGDDYVHNWHIEYLCDELQKVGQWVINREPKRYDLIINVSPGESKSTLATVLFPCWLWANDDTTRIISSSYSADLSRGHASLSRDCINSQLYQLCFPKVQVREDMDNKRLYKTESGGFRLSVSTGSAVTGEHGHLILIDDPVDPRGAKSEAIMASANEHVFRTLPSRKVDKEKTPTILIMQRLGMNDPTAGYLERSEDMPIKHIFLPATDEYPISEDTFKSKPIRGYYQTYMNPNRTGEKVLREQRAALGSIDFAGQYGQQPMDLQGNIMKRDWLQIIEDYQLPDAVRKASPDFVVDTAYTDFQSACPSAILSYVEHKGYCFILDYQEVYLTFGNLVKFLHDKVSAMGGNRSRIYIEPKASGKSTAQVMKSPDLMSAWNLNTRLNVIEWKMTEGDKVTRLVNVTPYWEAKRVFIVRGPTTDHYTKELLAFPRGTRTEAADLSVMASVNCFDRKVYQGYSAATA